MKTNFAYIDDVMDKALTAESTAPTIPQKDRAEAQKAARKLIGGFRIHDSAAESAALDRMIQQRKEAIATFRKDRMELRQKLAALGTTPLAICPTGAWYTICKNAGLFILTPDANNQIYISRSAFTQWTGKHAERDIDAFAKAKWPEMLKLMMPEQRSLRKGILATLQLPDPPADIAEVLCKVQSLALTVAAVPEAIRLAEKPSELLRNSRAHPKDLWAQAQGYADYADWLKRDPIIFTEHGTASAIIAQFGEFPIEQEIVDRAIGADTLLAEKPDAVQEMRGLSLNDLYRGALGRTVIMPSSYLEEEVWRAQQRIASEENARQASQQRMIEMSQRMVNSSLWTGR